MSAPRDDKQRFKLLQDIFDRALSLPAAEREAFVRNAAGEDPSLIEEVLQLLHHDQDTHPDHIGPYQVLELLGEGGMGTVYKAEQRHPMRRLVAVKVIKLGMGSKEVVARFNLERQALAAMSHSSIAKVYDAGSTESGQPFFAMELVEGVSLTAYCDKHKLPLEQRIQLFQQVCEGVQHAHQKGVVHRDLKPGNILVVREGGRAVPKVVDFGLAKATNRNLLAPTVYTAHNQMLGTPEYMAPEQAAFDHEPVDALADIYSLGVVLYELLTGVLPFPPDELRKGGLPEIQRVLREVEPLKPSLRTSKARSRALHGDLDWVVLKAMAKEPKRRYASAVGLQEDLQRYLDHDPVMAGPPSAGYRLRKLLRRYRGQFAAGALVLTTAVVGVVVGVVLLLQKNAAVAREASALGQKAAALANEQLAREREELARQVTGSIDDIRQRAVLFRRRFAGDIWLYRSYRVLVGQGRILAIGDCDKGECFALEVSAVDHSQSPPAILFDLKMPTSLGRFGTFRFSKNFRDGSQAVISLPTFDLLLCLEDIGPSDMRLGVGLRNPLPFDTRTTLLCKLPDNLKEDAMRVGLSGDFGFVVRLPDGEAVVHNGKPGPRFDVIASQEYSTNSKHIAYTGRRGSVVAVMKDAKELGEYQEVHSLTLCEDGSSCAFVVKTDAGETVMKDGHQIGETAARIALLRLSSDGRHIAYAAKDGERLRMIMDGKDLPECKGIRWPALSRDGIHLVYVAEMEGGEQVVSDGASGAIHEQILEAPVLSENGACVGYVARSNGKTVVVAKGKEYGPYDGASSMVCSGDGSRVAFLAQQGGKICVVCDDNEVGAYPGAGDLRFSQDGKRFAYGARVATGDALVVDGVAGEAYEQIRVGANCFSPNGQRVAFRGQRGKNWHIVVDGVEDLGYPEVTAPKFSADSQHVAYLARTDLGWAMIVNGQIATAKYQRLQAVSWDGAEVRGLIVGNSEIYRVSVTPQKPFDGAIMIREH